jgi:hypothetical protein
MESPILIKKNDQFGTEIFQGMANSGQMICIDNSLFLSNPLPKLVATSEYLDAA